MWKIDRIYPRSLDKIQGGHNIFHLHSHIVITRWKIIEIPIPKATIKHIEEISGRDKVTLIKFKNIAGVVFDNDCIAGVEYEYTEDENKNYSE